MDNYLADSLTSLVQSSRLIQSLHFHRSQVFTRAVLASEEWFETHLIRDAEPHELALFRPSDMLRYDAVEQVGEERWTATTRKGPERVGAVERASPLKGRGTDDPERCLRAARKLLDVYPLPRAKEHVEALFVKLDTIVGSIGELEDSLKRPLSRPNPHAEESLLASDLEDAIKREQMEIFALEEIITEKQAEIKRNPMVVKPKPKAAVIPPSQSNPFGKSTLLEQKASPVRRSPAPARKVATPVRQPSPAVVVAPQSTPRAVRTVQPATPSPRRLATAAADVTPRAVRSSPGVVVKKKAPVGVSSDDLEAVTAKVWSGVGEALRPWGRKTLSQAGEDVPSTLTALPFSTTLQTLSTILLSAPAPLEPASPHSVASSYLSHTDAEDHDPSPPSPSSLLEFELLNLLLSTLSGTPPIPSPLSTSPPPPSLTYVMRDSILASSLSSSSNVNMGTPRKEEPMVSMNAIKARLGAYAKERGWKEDMGTTAIYSLVSKTVLRIDRRGKEGPMLGFRL